MSMSIVGMLGRVGLTFLTASRRDVEIPLDQLSKEAVKYTKWLF